MDDEASSLKKDQLTAEHPPVDCQKQASQVTKLLRKLCFRQ
jgi:hypothetical protein